MFANWVSPWWQAACLPAKWDVCGFILPPLTVWHLFALENTRNPYVCGGAIDKNAVAALILIARFDYHGGRRLMLDDSFRERQQRRMFRQLRNPTIGDLHPACREYVDTCTRGVSRFHKGNEKPCAVPFAWHMVSTLSGNDPSRLTAAWNMAYLTARCLFDAMAEINGDDSIMTPPAQEMEDHWEKYQEIWAKQEAAGRTV